MDETPWSLVHCPHKRLMKYRKTELLDEQSVNLFIIEIWIELRKSSQRSNSHKSSSIESIHNTIYAFGCTKWQAEMVDIASTMYLPLNPMN